MTEPQTVPALLRWRLEQTPDAVAWKHRVDGRWRDVTWSGFGARVRELSASLRHLGAGPGDRVAIVSSTRLDWIEADLAALCAGAATTTVYPSSTAEDCRFILEDCGARICFVEDETQLAKLASVWDELPALDHAILFDGASDDPRVHRLNDLIIQGASVHASAPDAFAERAAAVQPDDLATLIYTSGTTGRPKGVMLTHDAWIATTASAEEVIRPSLTGDDLQYLFLPLSHSFGKVLQMIAIRVGLPTAVDGDIPYLVTGLAEVRPTFCGAVPRVFEKVHGRIHARAQLKGPLAHRLLQWSEGVGAQIAEHRQRGTTPSLWLKARYALAWRLVFQRIYQGFGGRIRCFVSGGAPLAPELAAFFCAADLLVLEGYGLTESSAASVSNRLHDFRFGTVGKPYPGVELRIADDGEVLLRGRGIMRGYLGLPDQTAQAIDPEGWLHTGDLGAIDDDGFLSITGRRKELIITAGGKNIAPARFEGRLKARCSLVSQVIMHGDRRKFCVALISLDPDALVAWAETLGLDDPSLPAAADHPAVREALSEAIEAVNAELPSYETVKRFAVLDHELTVEGGALTPSLKVRRAQVEARYRSRLDALYEDGAQEHGR